MYVFQLLFLKFTNNFTNMRSMFDTCSSLLSFDILNFNTKNGLEMNGMLYNCSSFN